MQEAGVRLRSEGEQKSEADKTKVTFESENVKAEISTCLMHMCKCKNTIIYCFSDGACSKTTSKILNRLNSAICGDFSNLLLMKSLRMCID